MSAVDAIVIQTESKMETTRFEINVDEFNQIAKIVKNSHLNSKQSIVIETSRLASQNGIVHSVSVLDTYSRKVYPLYRKQIMTDNLKLE